MTKYNDFLNSSHYTSDALAGFFLGLFEGVGGIYFNKTGAKYRAYMLIKLDLNVENQIMLLCINERLQLKASIHNVKGTKKNPAKIVMRGSSKHTLGVLYSMVEQYGLGSSKKIIMFEMLKHNYVQHDGAYDGHVIVTQDDINQRLKDLSQTWVEPKYFSAWLSGFLEIKMGFGVDENNHTRMYLSVIDDKYLIHRIQQYFQSHHTVVDITRNKSHSKLYRLTISGRPFINKVMSHFKTYPFLGHNQVVYSHFCERYNGPPIRRNKNRVPILKQRCILDLKKDYVEPFFVGLFEGDGTITIGRTGNLSYGLFQISLKYNVENHAMLTLIKKHIGGTINYAKKKYGNDQIRWVAVSQSCVKRILTIFNSYPLLTSRKICQLNYLKQIMVYRGWDYHLQTRDSKYLHQQEHILINKQDFEIPHYFGPWTSGFLEAEGSFRCTHSLSVYICQNEHWYVLNAFKTYFNSKHKLGLHKDDRSELKQYRLSMSGEPTLNSIIKHFETYPLLGYKKVSYDLFYVKLKKE
jgi:LAGLIDADG endonuclease